MKCAKVAIQFEHKGLSRALSVREVEVLFSTVGQLWLFKHLSCHCKLDYFIIVGTHKQLTLMASQPLVATIG